MLYCYKCKVRIADKRSCCPLCQGELTGSDEGNRRAFPQIEQTYTRKFALQLISFIALAAIIVCFAINLMFPSEVWWSLFAGAGIGCLWLFTSIGITQRRNLFINISSQLITISGLSVLWDLCTGWHGWALDFVIPIACIMSMLSMIVASKILKIPSSEYVTYLVLDCVYGIIPIVFYLTGCLDITYPSIVCVACSAVSIVALLLFNGRVIVAELRKKFHI